MKEFTYKSTEYTDKFEALAALEADLKNFKQVIRVKHKTLGDGRITALKLPTSGAGLYATTEFATKTLTLSLLVALPLLTMTENERIILEQYQNAFTAIYETNLANEQELKAIKDEEQLRLKEEAKEAARIKKLEEAAALKIQQLKPQAMISEPRTYYEAIGWLARNIGTIHASIRSDYESWFIKHFGTSGYTVADIAAKTANGNPMKYSISFKASLKAEAPAYLLAKEGVKKRSIDSVEYIWDLIENHGFRFGKTQDIEAIKARVPAEFITEFETGFGPEPVAKKTTRKAKTTA